MNDMKDIQNLKPNSHASKETKPETKNVKKLVNGKVVKKKTSLMKKVGMMVFDDGDVDNFGDHILWDVIFPSIKDSVWEILSTTIDSLFGKKHRKGGSSQAYYQYSSFSKPSWKQDDKRNTREPRVRNGGYDFDQFTFDNRGDAEEVLDGLATLIETYQIASVADLCDMAGVECRYTDNRYGWTSVSSATVERVRGGDYIINLPRPMPLD